MAAEQQLGQRAASAAAAVSAAASHRTPVADPWCRLDVITPSPKASTAKWSYYLF
jgi:hypothetical protein